MRKCKHLVLSWVGACTTLAWLFIPTHAIVDGAKLVDEFLSDVILRIKLVPRGVSSPNMVSDLDLKRLSNSDSLFDLSNWK